MCTIVDDCWNIIEQHIGAIERIKMSKMEKEYKIDKEIEKDQYTNVFLESRWYYLKTTRLTYRLMD